MKTVRILFWLVALLFPVVVLAEKTGGQVEIPLEDYNNLVNNATTRPPTPRLAPSGYALGHAEVNLTIEEQEGTTSAAIYTTLQVNILEDDWVQVPILPVGTAVESAMVDGSPVELLSTTNGLAWNVKKAGSYKMLLSYRADGKRSEHGFSLLIPLPQAAAISVNGTLPGKGLDVALIPSAGTKITTQDETTKISATIPSTNAAQLSWRVPTKSSYVMSRARYTGTEKDKALVFTGTFDVELFTSEVLHLKLFPSSVTLSDIRVDQQSAPVLVEEGSFYTLVKGQGIHQVTVDFEVPIDAENGSPQVELNIPEIPVSRFELSLPGKKELQVSPNATVEYQAVEKMTLAKAYVPMTDQVTFSWTEAVPEAIQEELRASSTIYHLAHAEEGTLSVQAYIDYEIARGETSLLELEVPKNVQINRVDSESGIISDWRVSPEKEGKTDLLSIFLNRKIKGPFRVVISYDQSLLAAEKMENIEVPLLRARSVDRQRGMVALLANKELTLKPVEESQVTRVGENQLPANVKDALSMTIAHTYKYFELSPKLVVQAATPERKQGKFDALVNTLISLGDVTMHGSANVEINIKSGTIEDLELKLPPQVNFLSLTAPSLRTHRVRPTDDGQIIEIQFTQEMEGAIRLEVNYERIMTESQSEVIVPLLAVAGSEVEQGRIAIEALTAVEVQSGTTEQLSTLEPTELPQQLILKTTNPILLAYKYVYTDPPHKLSLNITRHKQIEVQAATIDSATYRTLVTADGFSVTTSQFMVRNSREQFLRIKLPEGSTVWSCFVDGKAEKPALASGEQGKKTEVLIKIINSAQGFPVQLIYQTPLKQMKGVGMIEAILPRPDMVVTHSRWDVYLPEDYRYGALDTEMRILAENEFVSREQIAQEMSAFDAAKSGSVISEPLQIHVPTRGVHYGFEKIYANQAEEEAEFSLGYVSKLGGTAKIVLLLLAAIGVSYFVWRQFRERSVLPPSDPTEMSPTVSL